MKPAAAAVVSPAGWRHSACGADPVRLQEQIMHMAVTMLGWSAVLGLVQIGLAALFSVTQRGLVWSVGARDEGTSPLTGLGGRLQRVSSNFLETFPLFAAAVLAAVITGYTGYWLVLGVQLYFWARLAYLPIYAAGVPWLRTLTWAVSILGIVMVLVALL
jgi:uncharacterized MAPEG superfamily protein